MTEVAVPRRPAYPLSAVVGQEDLVEALLVCAVHPAVGGVLVRGERGTAKSTAVRALAPMLGEDAPLVELPLGATLDRLVGALDVRAALAGTHRVQAGMLARADGGVLYVDEVNLLPDHLVDTLLDAAASGEVTVERDGVSVVQLARFLLVGTMNPEEGELRPQLLDRFGLGVEVAGPRDPAVRAQIVRRRMDFDADPVGFTASWAQAEAGLVARIAAGRALVPRVQIGEGELLRISRVCAGLDLDGVRGDLVCAQAARALAALDGEARVDAAHVARAAHLALRHRLRRDPLAPPPSGHGRDPEVEAALEASAEDGAGSAETVGEGESGPDGAADPPSHAGRTSGLPAQDGAGRTFGGGGEGRWSPDPDLVPPPRAEPPAPADEDQRPPRRPSVPAALAARLPEDALRLTRGSVRRSAARRTAAAAELPSGRAPGGNLAHLDARPARDDDPVAALPTLLAALRGDRRAMTAIRGGGRGALLCLVVDTSGSMAAQRRLARVKGALEAALRDAYARRDLVVVVGFGGEGARTIVAPGVPVEQAAAAVRALPAGGRTPLTAGIAHAAALLESLDRAAGAGARARTAVLLTDGRAADPDGHAAHALVRLAAAADRTVVADLEEGAVRLGLAARLAAAAGADLTRLITHDPSRRSAAA